jgi:hypothetical protein
MYSCYAGINVTINLSTQKITNESDVVYCTKQSSPFSVKGLTLSMADNTQPGGTGQPRGEVLWVSNAITLNVAACFNVDTGLQSQPYYYKCVNATFK